MKDQIRELVASAIEELNEDLQYESLATVSADTPIFGGENSIDSISLARLVTDIELRVAERYAQKVILADEKAMSMRHSPYRTVGSLVDFIIQRMETKDE